MLKNDNHQNQFRIIMNPGLDGYGSSDKGEQIPVEPGVLTQKEVQFQKIWQYHS